MSSIPATMFITSQLNFPCHVSVPSSHRAYPNRQAPTTPVTPARSFQALPSIVITSPQAYNSTTSKRTFTNRDDPTTTMSHPFRIRLPALPSQAVLRSTGVYISGGLVSLPSPLLPAPRLRLRAPSASFGCSWGRRNSKTYRSFSAELNHS